MTISITLNPNFDGSVLFILDKHKEPLGEIRYDKQEKGYVFESYEKTRLNYECLKQIIKKIKDFNTKNKN
jgi:hypothetical protein